MGRASLAASTISSWGWSGIKEVAALSGMGERKNDLQLLVCKGGRGRRLRAAGMRRRPRKNVMPCGSCRKCCILYNKNGGNTALAAHCCRKCNISGVIPRVCSQSRLNCCTKYNITLPIAQGMPKMLYFLQDSPPPVLGCVRGGAALTRRGAAGCDTIFDARASPSASSPFGLRVHQRQRLRLF